MLTTAEADASDQVLSKISERIIRPAEDISTAQAWLGDSYRYGDPESITQTAQATITNYKRRSYLVLCVRPSKML